MPSPSPESFPRSNQEVAQGFEGQPIPPEQAQAIGAGAINSAAASYAREAALLDAQYRALAEHQAALGMAAGAEAMAQAVAMANAAAAARAQADAAARDRAFQTQQAAQYQAFAAQIGQTATAQAGQTIPTGPNVIPPVQNPNAPASPEHVAATVQRAKKNHAVRDVIFGVLAGAALAGIITAGALTNWFGLAKPPVEDGKPQTEQTTPDVTPAAEAGTSDSENEKNYKELTGYEVLDEKIDGSFTQYDNPGCYDSDGKISKNAVAAPDKVLELMGLDAETATPEEYAAAFQYVAYSQAETAAFVTTAFGMNGFSGLSYEDAAEKIKGMSPEEKSNLQDDLKLLFGQMDFGFSEVNGSSTNFYIREKNGEKVGYTSKVNVNKRRTLEMSISDKNGGKLTATVMVLCFNGSKTIVYVDAGGHGYVIEIPTDNPSETGEDGGGDQGDHGDGGGEEDHGGGDDHHDDGDHDHHDDGDHGHDHDGGGGTPPGDDGGGTKITENKAEKDKENLERIDNDIIKAIEEAISTGQIVFEFDADDDDNPDISSETLTSKPSSDAYEGTKAEIKQNDASKDAVQLGQAGDRDSGGAEQSGSRVNQISQENNYSENRGGANAANANENPVQADEKAQAEADSREVEAAPTGGDALDAALSEMGIN